jgi:hypothetical protein
MVVISLGFIAAATTLECSGHSSADQILFATVFGILALFCKD